MRYRWHDLRHTFISRLAESTSVSEETIRALAGHVSRQMLERYSHIRSQAKRAAIHSLEEQHAELVLEQTGHKNGHSEANREAREDANSLETNGGPARIRPEASGQGPTDYQSGNLDVPSISFSIHFLLFMLLMKRSAATACERES